MVRKLAAILTADVVGFSRLMEAAEQETLDRLKEIRRAIVQPQIDSHGGRVVKLMGDGLLAEFASVSGAMECAVEIQKLMSSSELSVPDDRRIRLRSGIHLGDIIIEGTGVSVYRTPSISKYGT